MKIPQQKVMEFLDSPEDAMAVVGDSENEKLREKIAVFDGLSKGDFDLFTQSLRSRADKTVSKVRIKVIVIVEDKN